MKFLSILILVSSFAFSYDHQYYPNTFLDTVNTNIKDQELKDLIHKVISSKHTRIKGKRDELGCNGSNCYSHKKLSYGQAKTYLFGELHLQKDKQNQYYVKDVYCNIEYHSSPQVGKVGPGKIPNHNIVNCEHTWPQSRFTGGYNSKLQKGDLHHLFPTNSRANSIRSSHNFGEVKTQSGLSHDCQASSVENKIFQPPRSHRGNVARAMFYFSTRYKISIDNKMERFLKKWHKEDPVDQEEETRNNSIYKIQDNRNPYIDYPELVDRIANF